MSGDIDSPKQSQEPMRAGPQLLQKVGVLSAKAALSSIPWAALVFDLGQSAIEFANARLTDRLLDGIGERIDCLESGARERLAADEIYQLSAQAAIRRMLTETNPRIADALARAVTELGSSSLPNSERAEIARALDMLTEPSLHLLQMHLRFAHGRLTPQELALAGSTTKRKLIFSRVLLASMPLLSWVRAERDLEQAGLIQTVIDGGEFGISPDEQVIVSPREVLLFGERVLAMCFDDPGVSAFGAFASAS